MAALFGMLLVTYIALPQIIHRIVYSRNRRLFGIRTVTIDSGGIRSESEVATIETKWSSFEKFRETPNLFVIYQTKDVAGIVPKRAFTRQEEIAEFRSLIASKVRQDNS